MKVGYGDAAGREVVSGRLRSVAHAPGDSGLAFGLLLALGPHFPSSPPSLREEDVAEEQERAARPHSRRLFVVLTDGHSGDPWAIVKSTAVKLRKAAVNVTQPI